MPFVKGTPKPPGSGRRKGTVNKRTAARTEAVVSAGVTPLEYMLGVLRDPEASDQDRKWAADAAAPYVHARRSSVDSRTVIVGSDPDSDIEQMTPEQRWAEAERLAAELGFVPANIPMRKKLDRGFH